MFKKTIKLTANALLGFVLLSTTACNKPVTQTNPYNTQPQQTQNSTYDQSNPYDSGYYGGGSTYVDPSMVNTAQNNLPTGSVTGRVVDSLTNMGLANARVEVMGIRPVIMATTDASGNFTLPNVPQGRQVLTVTKKEYTSLVGNSNIVVDVTPGNTISATQINLIPDRASIANGFMRAFDGFKMPRGLTINEASKELFVVDVIGVGGDRKSVV